MRKQVIVVPPQSVSVNVSVNVGGQATPAAPAPAQPVSAAVAVTTGAPLPAPQPEWQPPFQMPVSDVLRRRVPFLAHKQPSVLGDHVHDSACVDGSCALLQQQLPPRPASNPVAIVGWMLAAVVMWTLQYSLVLPLSHLGAVARSGAAQAIGYFLILLCGFGLFYSAYYACTPAVPRPALRPWGLAPLEQRTA